MVIILQDTKYFVALIRLKHGISKYILIRFITIANGLIGKSEVKAWLRETCVCVGAKINKNENNTAELLEYLTFR